MPVYAQYPWSLITALTALAVSFVGACTPLLVARRRFSADVLSANRQRWIDTFRDRLAELLSLMNAAQVIKRGAAGEWRGGAGPAKDNPALVDKLEKTFMAIAQIQLLTKAAEPAHQAINEAISSAVEFLQEEELHETPLSARLQDIITLGRGIIRDEWGRVKRGV
jgi:hypothetical protein